jgi:hypothetical protein
MASKLTALTSTATVADTDILYVVLTPGGTPGSRQITKANFFKPLTLDVSGTKVGINQASPDGTLHVHTATAGTVTADANADDLVVENSTNAGISILSPNGSTSRIAFGSPAGAAQALQIWNPTTKVLTIGPSLAGGSIAFTYGNFLSGMVLDNAGRLGLPTVDSNFKFNIVGNVKYNGAADTVQALTDGANIAVNFQPCNSFSSEQC